MGLKVGGRFNGTASDIWICIGFVPDYVNVWNVELATPNYMYWNKHMRDVLTSEGIYRDQNGGALADLALGEGIEPYRGGEFMVSGTGTAGVGTTTYGSTSSRYLKWDDGGDYRFVNSASKGIVGDALVSDIHTWTLDNSTTFAGHFNADVTGTYIGEGSCIVIDGKQYYITTLTATEGSGASEVILTYPAPSGAITFIGGMYSMKSYVAGEVTAPGFKINEANVNASGNTCVFEAGTYDN